MHLAIDEVLDPLGSVFEDLGGLVPVTLPDATASSSFASWQPTLETRSTRDSSSSTKSEGASHLPLNYGTLAERGVSAC